MLTRTKRYGTGIPSGPSTRRYATTAFGVKRLKGRPISTEANSFVHIESLKAYLSLYRTVRSTCLWIRLRHLYVLLRLLIDGLSNGTDTNPMYRQRRVTVLY
jgi:hypothetical protein